MHLALQASQFPLEHAFALSVVSIQALAAQFGISSTAEVQPVVRQSAPQKPGVGQNASEANYPTFKE
jgi:hypothetical protein